MKLSFAIIFATLTSMAMFIALVILSVLVYDNLVPGTELVHQPISAHITATSSPSPVHTPAHTPAQTTAEDYSSPRLNQGRSETQINRGSVGYQANHNLPKNGSNLALVNYIGQAQSKQQASNDPYFQSVDSRTPTQAYHGSRSTPPQAMTDLLPARNINSLISDAKENQRIDSSETEQATAWLQQINDKPRASQALENENAEEPAKIDGIPGSVELASPSQVNAPVNTSLETAGQVSSEETKRLPTEADLGFSAENNPPNDAQNATGTNGILTDIGAPLDEQSATSLEANSSRPVNAANTRDTTQPTEEVSPSSKPTKVTTKATRPATSISARKSPEIVGWPLPEALISELEQLQEIALTEAWATTAIETYQELNQLELTDTSSEPWLSYLGTLAETLTQHTTELAQSEIADQDLLSQLNTLAQSMQRRQRIWSQVHRIALQQQEYRDPFQAQITAEQISQRTETIDLEIKDPIWFDYLMLDKAAEIFSDPKASPAKHQAISRKIMSRLTSPALTEEQRSFVQDLVSNDIANQLRDAATEEPQLGQFLVDLEKYESKSSSSATAKLTSHYQNFYWNRESEIHELAGLINDHYRRSNVQVELSQALINRLIPASTTNHEPVRDRILGAKVLGQMQITNRIEVQLVPDNEHLSFRFKYDGRVLSRTRAHARGFTFNNLGSGLVNASKIIAVGENGIVKTKTNVGAKSRDQLVEIEGQMDNVPVIGGLAKRLAHQQHQSKRPQTQQIVENKMRNEFRSRIDSELETNIKKANQWFQTRLLEPLHRMELEPKVIQLKTTPQMAQVSYRLSGIDQIGANSPRPAVESNSLASFQLHSTAVNNIINRIQIKGTRFTPQEFMDHIGGLLGRDDLKIPGEQDRDDVSFEFASRDPVMLNFEDGFLFLNLRIKRLQVGKNHRWKNLIISARYSAKAMGQRLYLGFDDDFGLRVSGRLRLADQLAVRTVFSALFKPDFQFDILPPALANLPATQGMGITQLLLSQGWLTVSLNQLPAYNKISDQMRDRQPLATETPQQTAGNTGAESTGKKLRDRISRLYGGKSEGNRWK